MHGAQIDQAAPAAQRRTARLLVWLAVANIAANFIKFGVSSSGSSLGSHRATGGDLHRLLENETVTACVIAVWTASMVLYMYRGHREPIGVFRSVAGGWIAIGVASSLFAISEYRQDLRGQSLLVLCAATLILVVVTNIAFLTSAKGSSTGVRLDPTARLYRFLWPDKSSDGKPKDLRS